MSVNQRWLVRIGLTLFMFQIVLPRPELHGLEIVQCFVFAGLQFLNGYLTRDFMEASKP